jgi:hypothetical protein
VSLTISDQWTLARMEIGLCRSDPKLAGMLAVFASVYRHERCPAWEPLSPWRPRLSLVMGAILVAAGTCLVVTCELVLGRTRRAKPAIPGAGARGGPGPVDRRNGDRRQ